MTNNLVITVNNDRRLARGNGLSAGLKTTSRRFWLAAFCICLVSRTATAKDKEQFGDISTFANVPAVPGFPEGVAVHGNSVFVSGPARFGTAGTGPSAIHVFNRKSGQLSQTITVQGENLAFEHAVSNIAVDGSGRVYALSTQLGLIRFSKIGHNYLQQAYGDPLPDLPSCLTALPGEPCSPTMFDLPPIVNDVVFDDSGNAYVTDSLQATIFRYPPGGGPPEIWFQSMELEGGGPVPFGPNGIRLDPARQYVYFVSSSSALDPTCGTIFRLPLIDQPGELDLEAVYHYDQGEFPDQLTFGTDGLIYVTLAFSNQISVLDPTGVEWGRISSGVGDPIPMDNPAALAFDSRSKSLLVVNHALFSGDPAHFALLRVYVGNPGDPLSQP